MLDNSVDSTKRPPTLSGGRYVIAGVLGRGGNAGVYQGWDTHLGRWRAIKVLSHAFIKDEHVRARFSQEAATMARLDHPNLVKVYDISNDPFTPHIVMELCGGGAIIDWMKVHGAVPPRAACQVMIDTANAVAIAHAEDIIHRDIKPQNILIDHHGFVKLTDFGIARDEKNNLTMTGQTMGTYAFMAPEQRNDSTTVDPRTDIYSIGATLFTLLAVKTTTELFVAEKGDEILTGIPDRVVDFILKACEYKPSNRYQTVAEMIRDLEAVRDSLPKDPPHAALHSLAKTLPAGPPSTLADLSNLEDLLKSLALRDSKPTYSHLNEEGSELEVTTLGSSAKEQQLFPYYMPTTGGTVGKNLKGPTPSALSHRGDKEVLPSYVDMAAFTAEPAVDRELPADPTPPAPPNQAKTESRPASTQPSFDLKPWAVALGVALFFTALFSAAVWLGANDVGNAAIGMLKAEQALFKAAEASSPVIQEVGRLGGDSEALQQAYFTMSDAAPPDRGQAAIVYASQLSAYGDTMSLPASATSLIENLEKQRLNLESRIADVEAASQTPLGALALGLGVASTRP